MTIIYRLAFSLKLILRPTIVATAFHHWGGDDKLLGQDLAFFSKHLSFYPTVSDTASQEVAREAVSRSSCPSCTHLLFLRRSTLKIQGVTRSNSPMLYHKGDFFTAPALTLVVATWAV